MRIIIDGIKSIILLIIIGVVVYLVMTYLGYEINKEYFTYTKAECQKKLDECASSLIHKGIDNAQCDAKCVDPKLIIKKK
jgi:hypothetical protein